MSECCKFCGAIPAVGAFPAVFVPRFQCGTEADYSFRSEECKERTLPRYEALFPIPPWSTEPITAEVCERLGMRCVHEACYDTYGSPGRLLSVLFKGGGRTEVVIGDDDYNYWVETSWQLSLILAACKGAVK